MQTVPQAPPSNHDFTADRAHQSGFRYPLPAWHASMPATTTCLFGMQFVGSPVQTCQLSTSYHTVGTTMRNFATQFTQVANHVCSLHDVELDCRARQGLSRLCLDGVLPC